MNLDDIRLINGLVARRGFLRRELRRQVTAGENTMITKSQLTNIDRDLKRLGVEPISSIEGFDAA